MTDVSPNDIADLKQRVAKRNYKKYLLEMKIGRARALKDQKIRFEFPVTALIGTNGGGKSTVLGSSALAYKSIKPGDFFPKSNVGDTSMANWRVDYEVVDRDIQPEPISRNARFVSAKWRREELLSRSVLYFPIKRTVPAGEQTRYKKFIGIYNLPDPYIEEIPQETAVAAGRILARDISKYKIARIHKNDPEYIFLGEKLDDDFSQFHFGAGEASIIEMVSKIEAADDQSLIIIEEIENGLHPIATEKMVEYLIGVAKRKRVQVIFTTHSEYALRKLPAEAKWAAIDGQLYQGDLNIESLRALTGSVVRDTVAFVEDEFAKDWVDDMIRQYCPSKIHTMEVHAAGGYPFAASVANNHNLNPTITSRAIAIIDGDSSVPDPLPSHIAVLPGEVPEGVIWRYIDANIESLVGIVQQRCQVPNLSHDTIVNSVKQVTVDAGDPHLIFRKLAEKLGFLSELVVRRAMISIYNQNNGGDIKGVIAAIESV